MVALSSWCTLSRLTTKFLAQDDAMMCSTKPKSVKEETIQERD